MEERGRVSRAHLHLKKHGLKWLDKNRADFDRFKKVVVVFTQFANKFFKNPTMGFSGLSFLIFSLIVEVYL